MIIYLVGISCVGKSTVGRLLARKTNFHFLDLDIEVEKYYQKPIERIQNECFSIQGFREKASIVLDKILFQEKNVVISGTPSGLKNPYLQVYKKHKKRIDLVSIHLFDSSENIFDRLKFYDKDSKPIEVSMDELKRQKYIKKITEEYNYFRSSLERADIQLNIENVLLAEIPKLIADEIKKMDNKSP